MGMKAISLNTWGGKAGADRLLGFFAANRDADVFCLQEVWNGGEHFSTQTAGGRKLDTILYGMVAGIGEKLPEHAPYFRPHVGPWYGLATFARRGVPLIEEGDVFVHKERGYYPSDDLARHARNVQYATFQTPAGARTVVNFHGLWNGLGKSDSDDRLAQSDRIVDFLKTLRNPYVLVGDFNLRPDAESLKKFERFGLRNLIAEHGVTNTRSSFYDKPERYADYAFVSDGITVNDFKVLPDEVSDHLALYLDFE